MTLLDGGLVPHPGRTVLPLSGRYLNASRGFDGYFWPQTQQPVPRNVTEHPPGARTFAAASAATVIAPTGTCTAADTGADASAMDRRLGKLRAGSAVEVEWGLANARSMPRSTPVHMGCTARRLLPALGAVDRRQPRALLDHAAGRPGESLCGTTHAMIIDTPTPPTAARQDVQRDRRRSSCADGHSPGTVERPRHRGACGA